MREKNKVPRCERVASAALLCGLLLISCSIVFWNRMTQVIPPLQALSKGKQLLQYNLPSGWKLVERWKTYPENRLYEKIDGRATLFQEYGIIELQFATASTGSFDFDIFAYLMENSEGALGIYLAETPREFTEIDLGTMADSSGGIVRVYQGRTYLVVMSLERNSDEKLAIELARSMLGGMEKEDKSLGNVINVLPRNGRIKGTLTYGKQSTYGFKSLHDSFKATYRFDELQFDYLLKKLPEVQGDKALQRIRDELEEFGGEILKFGRGELAGIVFGHHILLVWEKDALLGLYGEIPLHEAEKHLEMLLSSMPEEGS